jgi:hypothetical protein
MAGLFGKDGLLARGLPLRRKRERRRTVEVGWLVDAEQAGFIYDAPRQYQRKAPTPPSTKAVGYCPAVLDYEARIFEVPCPFDVHLRLGRDDKGNLQLMYPRPHESTSNPQFVAKLVVASQPSEWREPGKPVLQIKTPYRFVADEPVWINQLPPFYHYRTPPLPGVMIGGRFPIHDWPRILMWAFEWHDVSQDVVLKRGEPWFCVRFETEDPSRQVRLVEAEMTEEFRTYLRGMDAVTQYVSRTFSLFPTARSRRPKQLLTKARR